MITDLLIPQNIRANVQAESWQEAGRIVGDLMVQEGKVEAKYVDAMINSVEKYGPYIVVGKGIALFHARPQDGVKEVCMSLITVRDGVAFGSGEKDPVKLVFAFAAVDNKRHIGMLSELMLILREDNIVGKILEAENEVDIAKIIVDICRLSG